MRGCAFLHPCDNLRAYWLVGKGAGERGVSGGLLRTEYVRKCFIMGVLWKRRYREGAAARAMFWKFFSGGSGLQISRQGVENGGGPDWTVDPRGHIGIIGGFCARPVDGNRAHVRVRVYVSACQTSVGEGFLPSGSRVL